MTRVVAALVFGLGILAADLFARGEDTQAASGKATAASDTKPVRIITRREGDVTHFCVENLELCEVTMTFEMGLVNLKSSTKFPFTGTFAPGQTTEAFVLTPLNPTQKWEYSYTNYYKLGSHCASHDDAAVYQLPYAPGEAFRVTQGYNGSYSHTGPNKYAIDWKMPEGTPVYAARAGQVIKVKDDSDKGGSSMKFDRFNNFVLIRHSDGTLGHYCHLQKGGSAVRPGQWVRAGDLIAHSGNTGFSSGPHLHFCVFKTKNGRERQSLPVKFKTTEEVAAILRAGHNYKAVDVHQVSVPQTVSHTASQANQGGSAP